MWLRSEVGPKRGSLGTLRARTETIRGTLKYNSNAVPALHSRWIGDFRGGGGRGACLFVCLWTYIPSKSCFKSFFYWFMKPLCFHPSQLLTCSWGIRSNRCVFMPLQYLRIAGSWHSPDKPLGCSDLSLISNWVLGEQHFSLVNCTAPILHGFQNQNLHISVNFEF